MKNIQKHVPIRLTAVETQQQTLRELKHAPDQTNIQTDRQTAKILTWPKADG